jgi:hypothetical protein
LDFFALRFCFFTLFQIQTIFYFQKITIFWPKVVAVVLAAEAVPVQTTAAVLAAEAVFGVEILFAHIMCHLTKQ